MKHSEVRRVKWSKRIPIVITVASHTLSSARVWFQNYLHGVSRVMLFASRFQCVWQSICHMRFDCICCVRIHYNICCESYAICKRICICSAHYTCISIWVHYNAFIALSQMQCNAMRCFAMQSDCILYNATCVLIWNIMHCNGCNCFALNARSCVWLYAMTRNANILQCIAMQFLIIVFFLILTFINSINNGVISWERI